MIYIWNTGIREPLESGLILSGRLRQSAGSRRVVGKARAAPVPAGLARPDAPPFAHSALTRTASPSNVVLVERAISLMGTRRPINVQVTINYIKDYATATTTTTSTTPASTSSGPLASQRPARFRVKYKCARYVISTMARRARRPRESSLHTADWTSSDGAVKQMADKSHQYVLAAILTGTLPRDSCSPAMRSRRSDSSTATDAF
ncbi:hypothetical protein EVAR_94449_1 [Eumeta japonica]|uniref:Uncharacterized protein n=1 Tax=Eumeta variegata TaxID=151549 RepID=A0A4C1ZP06_EUMVA|nr:hypothetical protein EVAR_94449_1 [Eumeta japonica]